jgi:protease YdgD
MRRLAAIACIALLTSAAPARAEGWQAAIGLVANGALDAVCSGVLVQPDIVATAAHCVEDAEAGDLQFAPAIGGAVFRGVEIVVSGGFEGGPHINPARVKTDWALVRIAGTGIAPAPVAGLEYWRLRRATADGARFAAFGVDRHGALRAYGDCRLQAEHGDFFVKVTGCPVVPGDSGGPVFLIGPDGIMRLVGLIVGFRHGETMIVSARRFAPWIDGTEPVDTRALIASQPEE